MHLESSKQKCYIISLLVHIKAIFTFQTETSEGSILDDPRVPWRHKRLEMIAIARIIVLVAKWLAKIKRRLDVGPGCRLCKRAREQHGASTENLAEETYGHINSAFCDGMVTTFTAASRPSLHLETTICQHASCTNTSELAQGCQT